MSESAPLLTPREGADAPSRRVRIARVIGASLLAAGAVVAVDGAFPGGDAVALLRSGQMPSVSPAPRELQQAQELMMAQEQQQMQADAQVAAVDQASFEDREAAAFVRVGHGVRGGRRGGRVSPQGRRGGGMHHCPSWNLFCKKGVAKGTSPKSESRQAPFEDREPAFVRVDHGTPAGRGGGGRLHPPHAPWLLPHPRGSRDSWRPPREPGYEGEVEGG